jgi:cold shock CspA family protein
MPQKGKLTTWKDDRGFGFIRPDEGGKEVFLHVSEVQGLSRRPRLGDIVSYEPSLESDGKVRATQVSIQGVVARPQRRGLSSQESMIVSVVTLAGITAAVVFSVMKFMPNGAPSLVKVVTKPNCEVKGNISVSSGQKIYHIPGMEDYVSTVIDEEAGEKWFCSESEAIAAGWKKAPR